MPLVERWDEVRHRWRRVRVVDGDVRPNDRPVVERAERAVRGPRIRLDGPAPAPPPPAPPIAQAPPAAQVGGVPFLREFWNEIRHDQGFARWDPVDPAPIQADRLGAIAPDNNIFLEPAPAQPAQQRRRRPQYIARDRNGLRIMAEHADDQMLVPAPAAANAPDGAYCVPINGPMDGYRICHHCSWMYAFASLALDDMERLGISICVTCFPRVSACVVCGNEQTAEEYRQGRRGHCKECAPTKTLHVKQRVKFKPSTEILKAREGTAWNLESLHSVPTRNS